MLNLYGTELKETKQINDKSSLGFHAIYKSTFSVTSVDVILNTDGDYLRNTYVLLHKINDLSKKKKKKTIGTLAGLYIKAYICERTSSNRNQV